MFQLFSFLFLKIFMSQDKSSANFCWKGPDSNYFWLCKSVSFCFNWSALLLHGKQPHTIGKQRGMIQFRPQVLVCLPLTHTFKVMATKTKKPQTKKYNKKILFCFILWRKLVLWRRFTWKHYRNLNMLALTNA